MKRIIHFILLLTPLVLACYQGHGLSPPGNVSGIQGRVTFIGAWPDSTQEVRVAVMKSYPEGIVDAGELMQFVIENLASMSDPIPLGVESFDYELELIPDEYAWVLVVWLPENILELKELGAYYFNPEDLLPAPVNIPEGVMLQGIDIVADFANVLRDEPFF